MDNQRRRFPTEIFRLIATGSTNESLKAIRLTCRTGWEVATPLLFQCFRVRSINSHTLKRLQEVARHPQLARSVRKFEYHPYIRKQSNDNNTHWELTEQNSLLASSFFIEALTTAIGSFVQLSDVELGYPEYGKRAICNSGNLRVLSDVVRHVCSNRCLQLVSLNMADLLLVDIPQDPQQGAGDGTEPTLRTVERLDLKFHPVDMPYSDMTITVPDGLRWLLSLATHLSSIRIVFRHLDKGMRSFDWSVLQCTKLKTLELVGLEMSELSLVTIMIRSAHCIRQIIIDRLFLFNGTWTAVYDRIADIEGITDITGIHGRRYLDDRGFYTKSDAASYCRLFAAVEKRRESQGLPSMRKPISIGGVDYRQDFWDMETSLY